MKKTIIILSIIIILGLGFGYLSHVKIKQAEKINQINENLAFFKNGQPIPESNDLVLDYFNQIVTINEKINKLDYDHFYENNIDLLTENFQELVNKTQAEIDKYTNFELFSEELLLTLLNNNDEKQMYLDVYYSSDIVKSKTELQLKIDNYIEKLQKLNIALTFLIDNKAEYTIENKTIIYKNDTFKNEYELLIENTKLISI